MLRFTVIVSALMICAAAGFSTARARAKTDIIVLRNGDRVTCEIKTLSRGKLEVGTDDVGTIYIEWDAIETIESQYYFRVEVSRGERYFGSIRMEPGTNELRVVSDSTIYNLPRRRVVEITPLERTFWSRFDGSLSIGYNFTKASDVSQLTFDWSNVFRTERNLVDTKINAQLTDRGGEDQTIQRWTMSANYHRLLRIRWTGLLGVTVERNDELALKRRFLGTVGTGSHLIASNRQLLRVSAGVAFNSEIATDGENTNESLEVALSGDYNYFAYNTPKTDIAISLDVYPSLTEDGRVRTDFEIKAKREIIKDLFFSLVYYINYDNKPASGTGKKQDYGIETSVGWSY